MFCNIFTTASNATPCPGRDCSELAVEQQKEHRLRVEEARRARRLVSCPRLTLWLCQVVLKLSMLRSSFADFVILDGSHQALATIYSTHAILTCGQEVNTAQCSVHDQWQLSGLKTVPRTREESLDATLRAQGETKPKKDRTQAATMHGSRSQAPRFRPASHHRISH